MRLAEDCAENPSFLAELFESVPVLHLERVTVEAAKPFPRKCVGNIALLSKLYLGIVSHLEKKKVGKLFNIIAVGDAVVAQGVGIIPDFIDNGCSLTHLSHFLNPLSADFTLFSFFHTVF